MRLFFRSALFLLGMLFWVALTPAAAQAAGVVGTGSPASCDSNDLADALQGGGLVTFNCGANPPPIVVDTYVIQDDTTIRGGNRITLDGENLRQHFIVDSGATLTLEDIVLTKGESGQGGCISVNIDGTLITTGVTLRECHDVSSSLGGGAVYNLGVFTATETIFISNHADQEGGAIFNRGRFTGKFVTFEANSAGDDSGALENDSDGIVVVNDGIFVGNTAAQAGGALGNTLSFPDTEGSMTIRRSLFVDNTAATFGGAVNNVIGGITIINSTFVRNTADDGGAIYASGSTQTTIQFSTFDDNRADLGGAIYRPLTGVVNLGYSLLKGSRNRADSADQKECDGPALNSQGYNIVEDNTCVDGTNTTDMINTSPQLGPLQDNGGFSMSELPNSGSPALNKVPPNACSVTSGRDQRFAKRIGNCDIGAVERGGIFESAYFPRIWGN